mmetsp:Transcript_13529/g.29388  ORF Transcript_13529/g.29388 Transcript_13529/m.29388 type:complete len:376 (-) Transcript_13529:213-1340(-)
MMQWVSPDHGVDRPATVTERKRPQRPASMSSSAPSPIASAIVTPLTILFWLAVVVHYHTADALSNGTTRTDAGSNRQAPGSGLAILWGSIKDMFRGTANRAMEGGPENLTPMDLLFFGVIIVLALEFLSFLVKRSGYWFHSKLIPVRGKHLDELSSLDHLFIGMNRIATAPFVYFLLSYLYHEPNAVWDVKRLSVTNVILPIPCIFVIYDFFYTILHWALHIKAIYGFIHKHHHHQKAPSRATVDAINVHPVEFFLGEYNHIFACFLYCRVLNMELHAATVILFLIIGAVLAGLNHTRFDCVISLFGVTLYDSKYHDVHHRIPQSNYGQYIMFWDHVFGSFRDYNPNDRINAKAQLDPRTGKSFQYMEALGTKSD